MRPALLAVMLLAACSKSDDKPAADKPAPPADKPAVTKAPDAAPAAKLLTDGEQVCDLFTPAEIEAELKTPITAARLPKAGEYGAPSCAWTGTTDGGTTGVEVTLFFHPDSPDGPKYFAEKLMCDPKDRKDLPGIADEAVLCGGFWIRKGNSFLSLRPASNEDRPWIEILPRLAKVAVARLP
jgi:hypothetical protein